MPIDLSPERWREALIAMKAHPGLFQEGTTAEVIRRCNFETPAKQQELSEMGKHAREKHIAENIELYRIS